MKYIISILLLTGLVGCAGPRTLLVKNCKDLGSGLYQCEEIPPKETGQR